MSALALVVAVLPRGVVVPARLAPRFTLASAAVRLPVSVVMTDGALAPVRFLAVAILVIIVALPCALFILAIGVGVRIYRATMPAFAAVVGVGPNVGLTVGVARFAVGVVTGATRISTPCSEEEHESQSGRHQEELAARFRHRSRRSIN